MRRNTYLVAIKASRMAQSSNPISEHDLSNAFANVMANDREEDQARTPMVSSPEKGSNSDAPDLRRRDSLRSSLNAMKKKILGGAAGERKDDFWDPAAPGASSDIENLSSSDAASSLNSGGKKQNGEHLTENGHELGPKSLPSLAKNGTLPPVRRTQAANVVRRNSIAKMGNGNKEEEEEEERTTNGNTTVILVRGNTDEEEEEKDS